MIVHCNYFFFTTILLIIAITLVSSSNESIFWDFKNDDDLLEFIEQAEKQLKIYIYPFPKEAHQTDTDNMMVGHFKIENMFRKYLKSLSSHVSADDSRHAMVVDDPEIANAFLIDHDWMKLTRLMECNLINDQHMKHIVHNVVDLNPYYNRSQGKDHFFLAVYDKSYCGPNCDNYEGDKSMRSSAFWRILDASSIGNYGMDRESFTISGKDEYPCHRAGYDIVVPQLMEDSNSLNFFNQHGVNHVPVREFDSTFSGCSWGERTPLETMVVSPELDYENGTERFIALTTDPKYKLNGNPDMSLIYRGYFMYDPCGLACWSRRKYEAFAHFTIPIIVTSGAIQAFEKFIDWTKLSVKMSLETWYDDNKRNEYRKRLRSLVDEHRHILDECWRSINKEPPPYMKDENTPPNYDNSWLEIARSNPSSNCGRVIQSPIWQKIMSMQNAFTWFDFSSFKHHRKNAFRLLTLEIFCRVMSKEKMSDLQEKVCSRPSDYTARREYV